MGKDKFFLKGFTKLKNKLIINVLMTEQLIFRNSSDNLKLKK